MVKAYSYIRMSTPPQQWGDSKRRQSKLAQDYATKEGLDLDTELQLENIGVSAYDGSNVESGSLGRFLQAVKSGKVERGSYLLIESLDRLSREVPIRALSVLLELTNAGIEVVTLQDERRISGNIAFYDLLVTIVHMERANDESKTKAFRSKHSWDKKRGDLASKKLTARCPAWLRLATDRKTFEVIEERAEIVRRIFEMAADGMGNYLITTTLNRRKVPTFGGKTGWQKSSIQKILTNPSVLGTFQPMTKRGGKREPVGNVVEHYYPRVVSEALFNRATAFRQARRQEGGGRKGKAFSNLFSKVCVCGYCNGVVHLINRGSKGGRRLICNNAHRKVALSPDGQLCRASSWDYDSLEASFFVLVSDIDLSYILPDQNQASERKLLLDRISETIGKRGLLEVNRKAIFDQLGTEDKWSEFTSTEFRKLETKIIQLNQEEKKLREQLSEVDASVRRAREGGAGLELCMAVLMHPASKDSLELRAKLASYIKATVDRIELYPNSNPSLMLEFSPSDRSRTNQDIGRLLKEKVGFFGPTFSVHFRNGKDSHILPNPDNPIDFLLYIQDDEVFVNTGWITDILNDVLSKKNLRALAKVLKEPNDLPLSQLEARVEAADAVLKGGAAPAKARRQN